MIHLLLYTCKSQIQISKSRYKNSPTLNQTSRTTKPTGRTLYSLHWKNGLCWYSNLLFKHDWSKPKTQMLRLQRDGRGVNLKYWMVTSFGSTRTITPKKIRTQQTKKHHSLRLTTQTKAKSFFTLPSLMDWSVGNWIWKNRKKTKPTKDEAKLIISMRNMIGAYIALASNTYSETFHSLDEIRVYVVKKDTNDND